MRKTNQSIKVRIVEEDYSVTGKRLNAACAYARR